MEISLDVAEGAGGVLFLRGGSNRVADQVAGRYPLMLDFEGRWRSAFEARAELCERIGARYLHFIAPAKECALAHLLPGDMPVIDQRPVAAVLKAARGSVDALYPLEALQTLGLAAYGHQDTHWRAEGAVLAYRLIIEALGLRALKPHEIESIPGVMNDLGIKIGAEPVVEPQYAIPTLPHHVEVLNNHIKPLGNLIVTEIDDPKLPTAVIFRDSFLTSSHRLFAQHFRRLVYVWQPNLDLVIIERERPDFIVTEQAERFLVAVPDDAHGKTNAEYVAEKLKRAA